MTDPAFYVMTDYDQTAAEASTLDEARAKAQAIFRSDSLQINVSIHDAAGELVEDLGRSPGAPLVNLARNVRRSKP
jgi:hypothetical protein